LLQAWCLPVAVDDKIGRPICELLGYLPLAVRLAGRYMRQTSERPADYLDWLQDQPLDALDHGKRRLESVSLLIKRSIAKLSEPSLKALYVTGLLALAPFKSEVVAGALDVRPAKARQLLGELVSFGLLVKQTDHQDYAVSHRLIHTYTSQNCQLSTKVTEHLVSFYSAFARKQEQQGQVGYTRLDAERAHLIRLSAVCEQQQLWRPLIDLVWAVENFLDLQGFRSDQLNILNSGLRAAKK
jgi:predicted transcriptional regulator